MIDQNITINYLQLQPQSVLPDISNLAPFRSILIIDAIINPDWQAEVSGWLVKCGCLYAIAWGKDAGTWDDSIDFANLEAFKLLAVKEEKFVMTACFEDEPLKEVFWFAKNSAFHPTVELLNTLILDISFKNRETEMRSDYADA
jgi:hypothetical protein